MSKIYPQAVTGKYRRIKDISTIALLLIYFLPPWIRWDRPGIAIDQAIMIDLPMRRAYFFNIEIWPEDIFYISTVLIAAAFGLFIFTAMFGRIWCGYTCPHTVFAELFVKIEAFFQGDRNARIRLDESPNAFSKFVKKFATHLSWLVLCFAFAFGWVCYFYDAPSLVGDIYHGQLGTGSKAWLFGLTASTYFFAGFMRERVCTYICPYGRFQSAMLDDNTLLVTYHKWRGEPRRAQGQEPSGDCINCNRCVVVCPMGIDIRDGLQIQCINCGLCVDACNDVMQKIGKPLDLIAYDSVNTSFTKQCGAQPKKVSLRPKIIFYSLGVVAVLSVASAKLFNKPSLTLSVEKERSPLFTVDNDGFIRNTYYMTAVNKTSVGKDVCLVVAQEENYLMKAQIVGVNYDYGSSFCFSLPFDVEKKFKIFVKYFQKSENHLTLEREIIFKLYDTASEEGSVAKSAFTVKR